MIPSTLNGNASHLNLWKKLIGVGCSQVAIINNMKKDGLPQRQHTANKPLRLSQSNSECPFDSGVLKQGHQPLRTHFEHPCFNCTNVDVITYLVIL